MQDKKEAEIIVEMRSGGIGIDRLENLIGLPASRSPAPSPVHPPMFPFPRLKLQLYKNTRQRGFASISIVAYRAKTGELLTSSGPYIGRTIRDDFWILGAGPRTVGNVPTTQTPK